MNNITGELASEKLNMTRKNELEKNVVEWSANLKSSWLFWTQIDSSNSLFNQFRF